MKSPQPLPLEHLRLIAGPRLELDLPRLARRPHRLQQRGANLRVDRPFLPPDVQVAGRDFVCHPLIHQFTDQGMPGLPLDHKGVSRGASFTVKRLIAAIRDQRQPVPLHLESALAEHAVLARPELARHDGFGAQLQELLVVRKPGCVALGPVEHALPECAFGQRIRNGILEGSKAAELLAPPLAHRLAELAVEVAEEEERLPAAPLLAHEEQRR